MQMASLQGSLDQRFLMLQKDGCYHIKTTYCMLQPQYPKAPWKIITMHTQIHSIYCWLQKFGIQMPMDCAYNGYARWQREKLVELQSPAVVLQDILHLAQKKLFEVSRRPF
ncbi:hypothetical protein RND71_030815 [Anisodus tanguticus]|uniref:Uncharacterized protein n=1 Tax=Anisodus tanguticus TaxID=243964 RepID=A0AAE1V1C8_9SOLA|nr:hypothetical protein RND71_030815 [Anisodus tanguticus]